MAVSMIQDLEYSGSKLIGVYNPNVFLFKSNTISTETTATATVRLSGYDFDYTFDAVFTGKNEYSLAFHFRFDISSIIKSFLNKLVFTDNFDGIDYDWPVDLRTTCTKMDYLITVNIPGKTPETLTDYLYITRSTNNIGEEGGSNIYSVWDTATRQKYYAWDNVKTVFKIFLRNPGTTTTVNFSRCVSGGEYSVEYIGDADFYSVEIEPDMTDEPERIENGTFTDWDEDANGEYPEEWVSVGRNGTTRYLEQT